MTPAEVRAAQQEGAAVLDLRTPHPFAAEHLEGALQPLGLADPFAGEMV